MRRQELERNFRFLVRQVTRCLDAARAPFQVVFGTLFVVVVAIFFIIVVVVVVVVAADSIFIDGGSPPILGT